ncbi:hypothetical protein AK830_g12140 [Neonectria ditissima]|uniref:DUF8212 domain-containing protein n=1 Tax=Neonectria ditissima TaxID=78410 RepID=A0A0P7AQ13_9HYPO|nr:hypothetical protein AK830_g12140 [Neonectria ditissima]
MRLLRAETLQFEEFSSDDIPAYAILSHCWEQDELSYQDMRRWYESARVCYAYLYDVSIPTYSGTDVREVVRYVGKYGPRFWQLRIARRMSWAANRQTTLIEDQAYLLLGLFDVNMPLLYGEGERAFQRLQEEIIKVDEDASILAWSSTEAEAGFAPNGLAMSPAQFHKYSDLVDLKSTRFRYVGFNPTMIP